MAPTDNSVNIAPPPAREEKSKRRQAKLGKRHTSPEGPRLYINIDSTILPPQRHPLTPYPFKYECHSAQQLPTSHIGAHLGRITEDDDFATSSDGSEPTPTRALV